jgi:hypothetical protein
MATEQPVNQHCSFCGKSQSEVKKLIAGPAVYICDECIGLCNDIIADELGLENERVGLNALPGDCRALISTILERGSAAVERLLRSGYPRSPPLLGVRYTPMRTSWRFGPGVWLAAVAREWRALQNLAQTDVPGEPEHRAVNPEPSSPPAVSREEFPEWAHPVIDRLTATQAILEAVAGQPLDQSGESLELAYENLRQTREVLRAGSPTARVD